MLAAATQMPQIAVVGAGVVGLSTAVCLQENFPGSRVTVYADKFTADTTSDGAGGIFLPASRDSFGDEQLTGEVCRRSWQHYRSVQASQDGGIAGVMLISGYQLYFTHQYGDPLPIVPLVCDVVSHSRPCSVDELKSVAPYPCNGYFTTTFIVENRLYLPFLTKRFEKAGGRLVSCSLSSLKELFSRHDIVVNCSGLGSVLLCSDPIIRPVRGQVVRVRAPFVKHFVHAETLQASPPLSVQTTALAHSDEMRHSRQLFYVLPQSELVVLGGTYDVGDDSKVVCKLTTQGIIQRCVDAMPSLKGAPIVKEWVGLRPGRQPIRLEQETVAHGGKSVTVVHNYGHGGNGVALSWGSAEVACRLVREALLKSPDAEYNGNKQSKL